MNKPAFAKQTLPQFSAIKTDQIKSDIEQAIEACKNTIANVLAQGSYIWESLVAPIDEADDKLGKLWS